MRDAWSRAGFEVSMPRSLVVLLGPALLGLACADPAAPSRIVPEPLVVTPPCASPAPLLGQFDPGAPDYIVVFHDTVDAQTETAQLATQYSFTPSHVYVAALRGFSAALPPATVADLRCETSVAYLEYDQVFYLAK